MNTPAQTAAHAELVQLITQRILDASHNLPKEILETFSLAALLNLLFLIRGEQGAVGEFISTMRGVRSLTGSELYWKWPDVVLTDSQMLN